MAVARKESAAVEVEAQGGSALAAGGPGPAWRLMLFAVTQSAEAAGAASLPASETQAPVFQQRAWTEARGPERSV